MVSVRAYFFCGLVAATPAFAIGFKVMDATIDAAPGQQIAVLATGPGEVQGMNLTVEVQGAPLAVTDIIITGTIWADNNTGPNVFVYPSEGFPNAQYGVMFITTASGTVATPGTAAILIVDATGLDGQTAIVTANYVEAPSNWAVIPSSGYEDGNITVRSAEPPVENAAPQVDAGPDQTVTAGDLVNLDGFATDPDGDELSFLWVQLAGPPVSLSSTVTPGPTFLAPDAPVTTVLEFQLRVSDGIETATNATVVTVYPRTNDDEPDDGTGDPGEPPVSDDPISDDDPEDDEGSTGDPPDDGAQEEEGDTQPPVPADVPSPPPTDPAPEPSPADEDSPTDPSPAVAPEPAPVHTGTPACAMGVAEAALLSCGGLWLMLLVKTNLRSRYLA